MIEIQNSNSQPASAITSEDYARIKARLSDLLLILMEDMLQDSAAQSMGLTAMAPIVIMMIQNYDGPKLLQLMTCLEGISRAVSSWDSSQEKYEETIIPLIRGVQEALS